MTRSRRGSANFEHFVAIAVLSLAGLGGLGAVGIAFERAIDAGAPGRAASTADDNEAHSVRAPVAAPPTPSPSAQAGVVDAVLGLARRGAAAPGDVLHGLRRGSGDRIAGAGEHAHHARALTDAERAAEDTIAGNNFLTSRSLTKAFAGREHADRSYEAVLGRGALDRLKRMSPDEHWIDMGSGDGVAVAEFLTDVYSASASGAARGRFPDVTAISFAKGGTDRLSRSYPGFRSLYGRFVEDIPLTEIRPADVITDVVGPASYSPHFTEVLGRYAKILKPGGEAFIAMNWERLFLTLPTGETLSGPSVIQHIRSGAKGVEFDQIRAAPFGDRMTFRMTKTAKRTSIPALKLQELRAGTPPLRIYELEN
jgi:hypothetical protein